MKPMACWVAGESGIKANLGLSFSLSWAEAELILLEKFWNSIEEVLKQFVMSLALS